MRIIQESQHPPYSRTHIQRAKRNPKRTTNFLLFIRLQFLIHDVKQSKEIARHAVTTSSDSHFSITSCGQVIVNSDKNKMDGQGATDRQLTDLLEEARKLKEDLRLDKAKLVDARCGSSTILNK